MEFITGNIAHYFHRRKRAQQQKEQGYLERVGIPLCRTKRAEVQGRKQAASVEEGQGSTLRGCIAVMGLATQQKMLSQP